MVLSNSLENIRKLSHLNKAMDELNRLYVIDQLCNIYNRNGFINIADDMFKECVANGSQIMISFIDMDGLKFINDNYGHNEGDFAIRTAAHIITECCVSGEIAGRAGGDEFYIYASDYSQEKLDRFERELVRLCEEYNESNGKPYRIELSCGAYLCETDSSGSIEDYLKISDARMYEQKMSKPDRKKR